MRVSAGETQGSVRKIKLFRAHHDMLQRQVAAKYLHRTSRNGGHREVAGLARAAVTLRAFGPPPIEGMYSDEQRDQSSNSYTGSTGTGSTRY
jgi:hypothetical protein